MKPKIYDYESPNQHDIIEHDRYGNITHYSLWSEEFNAHIEVPVSFIARNYPKSFGDLQDKLRESAGAETLEEEENAEWDMGKSGS